MAKAGTWVITTDGARPLAELAAAVAKAGGTLQSQLTELGILTAQGTAAQAAAWRRLPGVAAVEADSAVDIGPPDADPQ